MLSRKLRERRFSYLQFRQVTGLSKKEADTWVQEGIIIASLNADGHRRLYTQRSLMEGSIAKELADFSSRELLRPMMEQFRRFIQRERIDLARVDPDYMRDHLLVKVYTRKSQEVVPGRGVRGVVAYVDRFDPNAKMIGKSVYLIVDLTLIAVEVNDGINRFG
jgi:hypothetical protein